MHRRDFLQVSFPTTLGLVAGVVVGAHPTLTGSWTIANSRLKIVLSQATKGGLSAFTDLQSQRNFVVRVLALYRLVLVQKNMDSVEVNSLDAEGLKVDRVSGSEGETLTLTYGRHRSLI